ncbi:MAG: GntR family transcriptional regulator [Desulfarculaceae bacterium]|jgi:DNA-binding transcriptional regulator YhcF (GntR family)
MFKINQQSPLGIKEQIKGQIRGLILSGELSAGAALPSARDLAAALNVNRNTTWFAYRELAAEGFLKLVRGSGTYVEKIHKNENLSRLIQIFGQTLTQAQALGFDSSQVGDLFLNYLSRSRDNLKQKQVLVVECNQETLDRLAHALQKELGVETKKVLIQDLEADPSLVSQTIAGVDLVVCGFNHIDDFRRAAPGCTLGVAGIMLQPDIKLIKELMALPPGTRVGFTCANQRSTENLYRHQVFSSGTSLNRMLVGGDDPKKIQEMLDQCDVIFASFAVYPKIRRLAGPGKRLIEVDAAPDPAGIEVVRQSLALADSESPHD